MIKLSKISERNKWLIHGIRLIIFQHLKPLTLLLIAICLIHIFFVIFDSVVVLSLQMKTDWKKLVYIGLYFVLPWVSLVVRKVFFLIIYSNHSLKTGFNNSELLLSFITFWCVLFNQLKTKRKCMQFGDAPDLSYPNYISY